jgi:hypothetical protein
MKLYGPLLVGSLMISVMPASAADLLRPHEGEMILDAAWRHRADVRRKPDCSHLVHQVYTAAGFHYPYAQSDALYSGASPFRVVSSPQPGDLIVWRGHVGLVVDPKERTFYSSQRTGLLTASYTSSYWKGRGKAKFLRYDKSQSDAQVRSAQTSDDDIGLARPRQKSRIGRTVLSVVATGLKVAVRARH